MRARRAAAPRGLAALLAAAAAASAREPARGGATIGGRRFALEVAADPAVMHRGLGGRARIDPQGGMLFVYAAPQPLAFVMRDCPVPIDVAFLDGGRRVIAIREMKPEPPRGPGESDAAYEARLPVYKSPLPAQLAVELAGGRLRELGVRPGDAIELDVEALSDALR
jgi:uncharacterized membrane protein (UPF0127 family)